MQLLSLLIWHLSTSITYVECKSGGEIGNWFTVRLKRKRTLSCEQKVGPKGPVRVAAAAWKPCVTRKWKGGSIHKLRHQKKDSYNRHYDHVIILAVPNTGMNERIWQVKTNTVLYFLSPQNMYDVQKQRAGSSIHYVIKNKKNQASGCIVQITVLHCWNKENILCNIGFPEKTWEGETREKHGQ